MFLLHKFNNVIDQMHRLCSTGYYPYSFDGSRDMPHN